MIITELKVCTCAACSQLIVKTEKNMLANIIINYACMLILISHCLKRKEYLASYSVCVIVSLNVSFSLSLYMHAGG